MEVMTLMYQALYRKYRPRSFSDDVFDVAGQEHITETLRRQIIADRLSHAYLFVGTRGTGKTTCAKILSRAVNCLDNTDGNPCNKCISCIGIEDGSILDVLELDAASNNGVDDVRAMRDEAIYSPVSVNKRVYIIDEVHMLSTPAFNALLKILEEPPGHIIFILATTELHKVPATILSRCQKFSFKRLSSEEIKNRLLKIASEEELKLTDEAAEKLAILADGSMRDGISLLDQCVGSKEINLEHVLETIGLAGEEEIIQMMQALSSRNITALLEVLNNLYADGKDMAALLNELTGFIRDMLIVNISPDSLLIGTGASRTGLSELSKNFTNERLLYCLGTLKEAMLTISRGGMSRLTLEICLIRMCDEALSDDSAALASRIKKLEANSNNTTNTASKESDDNELNPLDRLSSFEIVNFG